MTEKSFSNMEIQICVFRKNILFSAKYKNPISLLKSVNLKVWNMQINECLTIKIQFVSATLIGDNIRLDTEKPMK